MSQSTSDLLAANDHAAEIIEAAAVEGRTPLQLAWLRLRRDRVSMISLGFIVAISLIAIFAPVFDVIFGHGPNYQNPNGLTPYGAPVGPSAQFPFGTDQLGRSVLLRVVFGARISLEVGIGATFAGLIVGLVIGVVSGYYGGRTDAFLARIMDILLSFPALLLALAMVARYGSHLWVELFVISFFSWPAIGRLVRGQVFALKEREFVEAARAVGSSNFRIMFIEIVPNLLALSVIYATLLIPANIVTEATLSYLGLGVLPPTASWGNMISDAQSNDLVTSAWWFLLFPSIALFLTTLAFNLIGDGLRDALDPRSGRSQLGS